MRGEQPTANQINPEQPIIAVDPRYFRPTEVEPLLGDPSKAREKLGWTPRTSFKELVAEMVVEDLKEAERDQLCKREGYQVPVRREWAGLMASQEQYKLHSSTSDRMTKAPVGRASARHRGPQKHDSSSCRKMAGGKILQ